MQHLRTASLGLGVWTLLAAAAPADPATEKLAFEMTGTRDAALRPFHIEIGRRSIPSTRDVLYVDRENFEQILRFVQSHGRRSDAPGSPSDSDGFLVTRFQDGRGTATYRLTDDHVMSTMAIVDRFFAVNRLQTPAWVLAIEKGPL